MITLRGRSVEYNEAANARGSAVLRLSSDPRRPAPLKAQEAYIHSAGDLPGGFGWYLLNSAEHIWQVPEGAAVAVLPEEFGYLADGDVVRLDPSRSGLRTLFRKGTAYNHFMLTERCNNYCLMCSQPPRNVDDGWIVDEVLEALPLIDRGAGEIGFTGGEPTLLGERFIELVRATKSHLPNTALHILSNGRLFATGTLARDLSAVRHHDLMMGIPIYADLPHVHDHVVQADGAFDDTIRGILALKQHGVRVEVRVVLQHQTVPRLTALARFLARNLLFVDHIALMGLEITGFARANLDRIWIDPIDYQAELLEAVGILDRAGMNVSIYNSQLCVLDRSLRPFARRSISDWKNEYMPECEDCDVKAACGGFFASAKLRYSRAIRPLLENAA
ncbi:His-Xaa-Ser system radical SAM maturase HxsC [Rhizorhabdus argentea]|uniref:His-Xaa-Ser system radical SAM maturase HxsC n=1 Tax=Rhizorhabdus argentea TaxID=1387174 RepID=UPI0030EE65D6